MPDIEVVTETNLKSAPLFFRGKVRDVYNLGDKLLIVATDRISAFDFVLPTPIPEKGKLLTKISVFWFNFLAEEMKNHLISAEVKDFPPQLAPEADLLEGRSVLVKKAKRINIECVVRGYLAGSAWKEYQQSGGVSGIKLPSGLQESAKLPQVIFTPATKAQTGDHDINITEEQFIANVGIDTATILKKASVNLYKKAAEYAEKRGIIIADTKFEFGTVNDEIILIDEIFTPDSSRFWDKSKYQPGRAQDSFDKQFIRDYLESIKWNKQPPVPSLPPDIVVKTKTLYEQAYKKLCQ
ncbi:MAG: phosphoribosylaminoimidazolesuccinocarboxamide synthase [bacterium]